MSALGLSNEKIDNHYSYILYNIPAPNSVIQGVQKLLTALPPPVAKASEVSFLDWHWVRHPAQEGCKRMETNVFN